ncbi:hypothetical protein AB0P15_31310 [Streptomyces sp. NPDC087917]|uniref:hypothetical protein n=1 Tax=Streptomyces sp. NPDC087917 TaxID=3155060 RepID=UPI00343A3ABE
MGIKGQLSVILPGGDVKDEDIGTLSIHYRDGKPVLTVNGGAAIPAELTVVDASGAPVTSYVAREIVREVASGNEGLKPLEKGANSRMNEGEYVDYLIDKTIASLMDR